jgi:hypothetical protein
LTGPRRVGRRDPELEALGNGKRHSNGKREERRMTWAGFTAGFLINTRQALADGCGLHLHDTPI